MSVTITAQAIPKVAASPWGVVDAHLYCKSGDWVILRGGLIHLVCDRVTRDGDPVSRLEEMLLGRFYAAPPVRVSFLDVLALVRKEIATWSPEVIRLVERALATNPDFPVGEPAFPLPFDRLREVARFKGPVPAPKRDLARFRRPARRALDLASDAVVEDRS